MFSLISRRSILSAIVTAAAAISLCGGSQAQVTLYTNRALLGGTDNINWATLGPTTVLIANNPVNVTSTGGMNVSVSEPSGNFYRFDQSNPYNGNFARGDALIDTGLGSGPISLVFAAPIAGAGAQIQADYFGGFTATIEAFDASNNSLGLFSEAGLSNNLADNSAIFIGIGSAQSNIKRIDFNVTQAARSPGMFAINRVDFVPESTSSVVPEGSSLTLLAGGGLPFLILSGRRFRRTRMHPVSRVSWGG